MQTRFAAHAYGGNHEKFFDFKTKTTKDAVISGIPSSIKTSGSWETKENIRKIWNSIFLESEGDRSDVQNYCFMFSSAETNQTYASRGEKPSTIILYLMDAQDYFNAADYSDDRISEFANTYKTISNIFSDSEFTTIATDFTGNADFSCKTSK